MPRTWQYSRWRRLALQGAMCLVLGASVGVAAYVGHQRRPARPGLGPVAAHGMLKYALPVGWELKTEAESPLVVTSYEPGRKGRALDVSVVPKMRRTDADGLLAQTLRHQLDGEPIEFLGEEGVLVAISFPTGPAPRGSGPDDGDDDQGPTQPVMTTADLSGLYAAVVLRDGTGVIVSLRGEGAFGPSSRSLLREILGTMQLSPNTGGTPAATHPTTHPATKSAIRPYSDDRSVGSNPS